MAGGLGLGSLFGTAANASGIGNLLGGVTSGLGSGLLGGQTIGGGDASQTIADALGWSYGLGDQTGSTEAQVALGDAGPTAMGTAQQYMQNQQQQNQPDARAQLDQGQGTPAQRALAAQPAVSMAQAYGPEGPWAPGGSSAPGAAAQGPQAPTQVAGPASAAMPPEPFQHSGPDAGFNWANTPGDRAAVNKALRRGYGLPPGTGSIGTSNDAPVTGAGGSGRAQVPTGPVQYERGSIESPVPAEPIYNQTDVNPQDPVGGLNNQVPLPQPRPAAADAAPIPFRAASTPASRTIFPPAAATPPAANDPVARATTPPAAQAAAPQNPIQGIMQALGLTNLPPQMQQAAQQIIRQVLGQLMPQLQGLMGGQQPYGGGQGQAIDPRTGQPPINPKTGQPYPAGTRWDQIAWSQGWDPAQQQRGQPWKNWENVPGSSPGINPVTGNPYNPARRGDLAPEERGGDRYSRPPGYHPAPPGSPYAPDPSKPDYHDPREWKYNPQDKTWGPRHWKKAPPGINVSQLSPDQVPPSMGPRMTPKERQRDEEELNRDPQSMTPEQMKKLRDLLRRNRDEGRRVVAQAAPAQQWSPTQPIRNRAQSTPLGVPPPGMSARGQEHYRRAEEKMNDPNITPQERAQWGAIIDQMEANPSGKGMLRDWGLR